MHYLIAIAQSDGHFDDSEKKLLAEVAHYLHIDLRVLAAEE